MRHLALCITLILALIGLSQRPATASWWNGSDDRYRLDLESGYDANTVTTVSGTIIALHLDGPRPQALVELAADEGPVTVVFGPRGYWAEHGMELAVGDRLTVRGSKAQGRGGIVYILAQWVRGQGQEGQLALRNEAGQPFWAGSGMNSGRFGGRGAASHPRGASRMGAGRMGR